MMSSFLTVELSTFIMEYYDNGHVILSDKYSHMPTELLEIPSPTVDKLRAACQSITCTKSYLNGSYTPSRYLLTVKYNDCTVECSIRDIVPKHISIIREITLQLL
jgi:hypothetical protein